MNEDILAQLIKCISRLKEEGSPIVSGYSQEHIAKLALRRWNSFERRNKSKRASIEQKIEDLAKGLRNSLEEEPALAGPLVEDYRYLAAQISKIFF